MTLKGFCACDHAMAAAWPPRIQPWGGLCDILNVEKPMYLMSSRDHIAINTSHRCLLSSKSRTLGRWAKPHFLSPFSAQTLVHVMTLQDAHSQVHLTAGTGSSHRDRGGCRSSPLFPPSRQPLSQYEFLVSGERKVEEKTSRTSSLTLPQTYPWHGQISTFPSLSGHREGC